MSETFTLANKKHQLRLAISVIARAEGRSDEWEFYRWIDFWLWHRMNPRKSGCE